MLRTRQALGPLRSRDFLGGSRVVPRAGQRVAVDDGELQHSDERRRGEVREGVHLDIDVRRR